MAWLSSVLAMVSSRSPTLSDMALSSAWLSKPGAAVAAVNIWAAVSRSCVSGRAVSSPCRLADWAAAAMYSATSGTVRASASAVRSSSDRSDASVRTPDSSAGP